MTDNPIHYIPNTTGSRMIDAALDDNGRVETTTRAIIGWRVGGSGRAVPVTLTTKPVDSISGIITAGVDPVADAGRGLVTLPSDDFASWATALLIKGKEERAPAEGASNPINRGDVHGVMYAAGDAVGRDVATAIMAKYASKFSDVKDEDLAPLFRELESAIAAAADPSEDDGY